MKKVKIGRMYLVSLWQEHKGLMALLVVGGVILVLAAMAPGAWATPNQSPLQQTIPPPFSISGFICTDENGDGKCTFPPDTPMQGVLVTLYSDPQYYTTGADGWYIFHGLAAGSTHVVEALGVRRTVTVGEATDPGERQDFHEGMDPIGGIALPVNRFELLAPWIGLLALMGVVVAAVVVRRRRQGKVEA